MASVGKLDDQFEFAMKKGLQLALHSFLVAFGCTLLTVAAVIAIPHESGRKAAFVVAGLIYMTWWGLTVWKHFFGPVEDSPHSDSGDA